MCRLADISGKVRNFSASLIRGGDAMNDHDVVKWLQTAGIFEASSMGGRLQKAYADFNGRDIGGFDMWFMCAVERCGYIA